jgi:hypothetical protein
MSAVLNRSVVITEQRMQAAEVWRRDWIVNAEDGTTKEDILKPEYWSLVSQRFTVLDHIEVRAENMEWIAELVVLRAERNYAFVYLKQFYQLAKTELPTIGPKYRVDFKGPQLKHVVVRVQDGAVIQSGISTKDEAHAWLANYEKAQ